jgi:hypothetical protein
MRHETELCTNGEDLSKPTRLLAWMVTGIYAAAAGALVAAIALIIRRG